MEMIRFTPSEDASELAATLHELRHTCHQCQQIYAKAAQEASSAEFTIFFNTLAAERELAAREIYDVLLHLGEHPHPHSIEPGLFEDIHQHSINGNEPTLLRRQLLLEACERQERRILEYYERVLQMALPDDTIELIRQQHSDVTAALLAIGKWKPLNK